MYRICINYGGKAMYEPEQIMHEEQKALDSELAGMEKRDVSRILNNVINQRYKTLGELISGYKSDASFDDVMEDSQIATELFQLVADNERVSELTGKANPRSIYQHLLGEDAELNNVILLAILEYKRAHKYKLEDDVSEALNRDNLTNKDVRDLSAYNTLIREEYILLKLLKQNYCPSMAFGINGSNFAIYPDSEELIDLKQQYEDIGNKIEVAADKVLEKKLTPEQQRLLKMANKEAMKLVEKDNMKEKAKKPKKNSDSGYEAMPDVARYAEQFIRGEEPRSGDDEKLEGLLDAA